MEEDRYKQPGFGMVWAFMAVFLVVSVVALGTTIVGRQRISAAQTASVTPAAPAANWSTYNDTGYAASSGISIQYPPDWKINVPGVRVVGNTQSPTAVINERVVYLPTSETPQEEWSTCGINISADACGAAPGDKTLSSSTSTINGIAAYAATMQNDSNGTYHVMVIRGNTATSDGIPFVEFTTSTTDPTALGAFAGIMASASFPN